MKLFWNKPNFLNEKETTQKKTIIQAHVTNQIYIFFNQQLVIETSEINKLYRIHDKRKIESGNSIEIHKISNNMNITGYNLIHLLSTSVDALGFGSKFKYDG